MRSAMPGPFHFPLAALPLCLLAALAPLAHLQELENGLALLHFNGTPGQGLQAKPVSSQGKQGAPSHLPNTCCQNHPNTSR
jgi:hypothetical protein